MFTLTIQDLLISCISSDIVYLCQLIDCHIDFLYSFINTILFLAMNFRHTHMEYNDPTSYHYIYKQYINCSHFQK